MPLIFALLAFFGWGLGDIYGAIASRKGDGYSSAFWSNFLTLILTAVFIPFKISELRGMTSDSILVLAVMIVVGVLPLPFLYEAMSVGNAALASTIAASFGAVTVLLSVILFHDTLSLFQATAVIVITVGVILGTLDVKKIHAKQIFSDKGVPYALAAMLLWGIYFALVRVPSRQIGWFWPSYLATIGTVPLLYLYLKLRRIPIRNPWTGHFLGPQLANVVTLSVGSFAYNFAITQGETAVVAPIASAYPLLFIVVGYFLFKDRLTRQQGMGILLSLLGIVLLAIN